MHKKNGVTQINITPKAQYSAALRLIPTKFAAHLAVVLATKCQLTLPVPMRLICSFSYCSYTTFKHYLEQPLTLNQAVRSKRYPC